MSWRVPEAGRVARMRRSYGDASFEKADLGEVAVEIVSAELAQDGGPAPDVRCTIAQRSSGGISPRVVSTSICCQAWSPVWKEMLRLELDSSTRLFDLVLWDESAQAESGEPSCLGELVIPLEDLQPPDRRPAQVRSMPLLQGSDVDARQVGTVFIRPRLADEDRPASRASVSKEPEMEAPSRPSADFGSPKQSDEPSGRTKSSPVAELGFFEASAQNAARNSNTHSGGEVGFRVLPSDGKGSHVFDTPNARVFRSRPRERSRSLSPTRDHSTSPASARGSFSREPESKTERGLPAGLPVDYKRSSVLLLRSPPHGASVVGEEVGVGVGLQVALNGEFFVSSIVEGTPAAHAARTDMISVGDVVEAIDGARCGGQPVERVISMMKGSVHTPVHLDLRRQHVAPQRLDSGQISILLIRLDENFFKLVKQEETFSAVLLQDLILCAGSYSDRFKYMGLEDLHDGVEATVEVVGENPGLDQRSSREICEHIVSQSSDSSSKFRQSPSMDQFRSIKHYIKSATRQPASSRPSFIVPTPMSKLEAAMEAVKASKTVKKSARGRDADDPLSLYPDIEMSIGNPASSLRMHSIAALQNTHEADHETVPSSPGRDLHVSIQNGHKEFLFSPSSPRNSSHVSRSARLDQTIYGTQFDMRHVYFRISALIVSIVAMGLLLGSGDNPVPWHWLAWISVLFAGLSPWAQYFQQYFAGGGGSPVQWIYDLIFWQRRPFQGDVPFWWLTASTFVSAALGDSLWESSALGYRYGAVGGFAHGMYYFGIVLMFVMIYRMRIVHPHAQSLMQLVNSCFGYEASGVYGLLVLYRILSLVWTGALTTGLLFVEFDPTMGMFWGSILCGVSPLFYTLMGGIRSLYVAHSLQALILFILLTVTLCQIPNSPNWIDGQGTWTLTGGGDLIIVRLLQGSLSLPWVTAILTDRAFFSTPSTSLAAMLAGTTLAYCFSFMSSLLGVHGRVSGIGASPLDVGKSLGVPYYHMVVILTIINSISVIDSCFVAVSKLGGLEAFGLLADRSVQETHAHPLGVRSLRITRTNVLVGRIFLMMVGGVGICCLASEVARPGSILFARLSGVMTMGVGPPMILLCVWQRQWKRSPTAFWLPIMVSVIIGVLLVTGTTCNGWTGGQCVQQTVSFAPNWKLGEGDYAYDLGLSVYSFLLAVLACITGFMLDNQFRLPDSPHEPNEIYKFAETTAAEEVDEEFK